MPTGENTPLPPFLGLGSEEGLRALGDALPDALFTTDAEGVVTFWNRGAERITGWSAREAIGQRCSLLAGDAVNGCACGVGPLRCGLAATSRTSKCCSIRTKEGRALLIVKNAVPIHAPDGRPVGALETFTEVGSMPGFEARDRPEAAGPPLLPRAPDAPRDEEEGDFCGMTGRDPAMQELYRMIGLVARSSATVLLVGESGAGKERVAEAIHRLGPRAAGRLVRVSCRTADEAFLEGELFGRASEGPEDPGRTGRFEEASGGTLLLDEIGDVSPAVQQKLLRVIEAREIARAGGARTFPVDVRLVCATQRDLRKLVSEGRFRADLYFRLAVFPIRVPPLREHLDDLPLLAARFLARLGDPRPRSLTPAAIDRLRAHRWPGNVRELQNALEYAALRAGNGAIGPEHLPAEVREPPPAPAAPAQSREEAERRALLDALERSGWNRRRAAEALGVSRVTLWKRLKRHRIAGPGEG